MAANDSNANDGEPSHLLALPVELLQCITNELGDETLTTFRLTCKAIEAATFDHFAKIFFEERHCCIYYEPRWTLLRRIVCSRIGDKIHRVIFTTDVLAPASCADLQLASAKGLIIIRRAQWNAMSNLMGAAGTRRQTPTLPSKDVIERCLRCIREPSPPCTPSHGARTSAHSSLSFAPKCQPMPRPDLRVCHGGEYTPNSQRRTRRPRRWRRRKLWYGSTRQPFNAPPVSAMPQDTTLTFTPSYITNHAASGYIV